VVAGTMAKRHIGSAIITKKEKLAGIFTSTDACRALAKLLGPTDAGGPGSRRLMRQTRTNRL
jgi:CBS domain-containing protein